MSLTLTVELTSVNYDLGSSSLHKLPSLVMQSLTLMLVV